MADEPGLVDHHVHLFSPAARSHLSEVVGRDLQAWTAPELSQYLRADDVAGSVILSVAYMFHGAERDGWSQSFENDWVASQLTSLDSRAVAFFSVNPIAPGAIEEMSRCHALSTFAGLKLHLANSGVRLADPEDRRRLTEVLRVASSLSYPVLIHLRSRREEFGAEDVEWLVEVLSHAELSTPLQVAHFGGWGGYDAPTAEAAERLIAAGREGALSRSWWLDLSAVVRGDATADGGYVRLAEQVRAAGLDRCLFGTDWPDWTARSYLSELVEQLRLSEDESHALATNRTPWTTGWS